MSILIERALAYESWLSKYLQYQKFMECLSVGVALLDLIANVPSLKPQARETAEHLCGFFKLMRMEIKKDLNKRGKIRCWQFKRREHWWFAFKIARLAGRLKQAAN